jgi:hypothetical protein
MKWGGFRKDDGEDVTGKPSTLRWSIFGPSLYLGGSCTRMVFSPADNEARNNICYVCENNIGDSLEYISVCLLTSKIYPKRFRHVPIIIPSRTWKQSKAVIKILYIYTVVPCVLGSFTTRHTFISVILHAEQSRHAMGVVIAVASTTLKRQLR